MLIYADILPTQNELKADFIDECVCVCVDANKPGE
jgi:hypothetical protein